MPDFIPLSVPSIKGNEWKYIKECLDTEWVSSAGKYVDLFEQKIAEYTGANYAIACVNGTSALHTSLIIAGVKENDEVIIPTITFIAPVNAVKYCNAHPVFMDTDNYYNIDIKKTIEFIRNETVIKNGQCFNKITLRRISALIVVHIFGNAVYIEDLIDLCSDRNIKIIEDATESLGTVYKEGRFKGKHTGTIGNMGCLSFNGNKIITTGGGGMILTNDEKCAAKAKYLTTQAKDDEIKYIHNEIGYNYRLTNIQAAMGVAQLEQLPEYIRIKKENYNYYQKQITEIRGLHLAETPAYSYNNHWMYALQIKKELFGRDKDYLMDYLKNHQVQARPLWYPNHLQKPYVNCQSYKIETAIELFNETLNLPCSVSLTHKEISYIVKIINDLANRVS